MKILALTGGIASGKSTVAKLFESLGATVLDADSIAHLVYRKGTPFYQALMHRYGRKILDRKKNIDRKNLAKILFGSKAEKKWIESHIHPETRKLIGQAIQRAMIKKPPIILVEAALHFETGYYRYFESCILVTCTPAIQIKRMQQRDGLTRQQAATRLKNQWPANQKKKLATWVIDNSGELHDTQTQVSRLFAQLV